MRYFIEGNFYMNGSGFSTIGIPVITLPFVYERGVGLSGVGTLLRHGPPKISPASSVGRELEGIPIPT
jgi:hypothetical protein